MLSYFLFVMWLSISEGDFYKQGKEPLCLLMKFDL